jgi:ABC-2 type transport system ATP-binding protein
MQNTSIEVDGLHKSCDGQPALRGASFAVGGNGILGTAGRDGARRTTAVEILQGLRSRDGGHVAVLGFDPSRERERPRRLLRAQLQASELADRSRVGAALQLADRSRRMFPPAPAMYGTRPAQATFAWGG